jgi:hypothetical protein
MRPFLESEMETENETGGKRNQNQELRIRDRREETRRTLSPVSLSLARSMRVSSGSMLFWYHPSCWLEALKTMGKDMSMDMIARLVSTQVAATFLLRLPSLSTELAARRAVEHGNSIGWMDGLWFVVCVLFWSLIHDNV